MAKYKVGDKVLIRSQYHKGATGGDYYLYFNPAMMKEFGGCICTISRVKKCSGRPRRSEQIYDNELVEYNLVEDVDNHWSWSAEMFENNEFEI